jgi:hypothetical protein
MQLPAQPPPFRAEALDKLIATGEAVFSLIRFSEMEADIKLAFHQLEKQFAYWAECVVREEGGRK